MDIALTTSELSPSPKGRSLDSEQVASHPERGPLHTTHPGDIDIETLRAAQAGNSEAVERFIRHYQTPLFAFISRSTSCGPHVEDIAQDVFLRVCRALPTFVLGRAKISTWIFQIAVRLIQDRRKRPSPPQIPVPDDLGDSRSSPEERCAQRRTLTRLEALVEQLPEEQRVTLVLSEFHGLSQVEVAEVTGCSPATLKTRLHRARKFLREELKRFEGTAR